MQIEIPYSPLHKDDRKKFEDRFFWVYDIDRSILPTGATLRVDKNSSKHWKWVLELDNGKKVVHYRKYKGSLQQFKLFEEKEECVFSFIVELTEFYY